jgi:hypothetical protein
MEVTSVIAYTINAKIDKTCHLFQGLNSHILLYRGIEEKMTEILPDPTQYVIATFPKEENFFFLGKRVTDGVATFGEGSYKSMVVGIDCLIDENLTQLWHQPNKTDFFNDLKQKRSVREGIEKSLQLATGLPEILERYSHWGSGYLLNIKF